MRGSQRGDTIIEVLFAITVFSIIAVAGLSLMNQGTATVQRALEISHVRNQIDAQADGLRYIHDSYVNSLSTGAAGGDHLWMELTKATRLSANASGFDSMTSWQVCGGPTPFVASKVFVLNLSQLDGALGVALIPDFQPAVTYARVRDDLATVQSDGLWIEVVKGVSRAATTPAYYDFHIRACWDVPGQSVPMTLGTIVRLYEP